MKLFLIGLALLIACGAAMAKSERCNEEAVALLDKRSRAEASVWEQVEGSPWKFRLGYRKGESPEELTAASNASAASAKSLAHLSKVARWVGIGFILLGAACLVVQFNDRREPKEEAP
jgi:hypothetical protein